MMHSYVWDAFEVVSYATCLASKCVGNYAVNLDWIFNLTIFMYDMIFFYSMTTNKQFLFYLNKQTTVGNCFIII